jgi:nucleotide-binding universal stress UspA family protein
MKKILVPTDFSTCANNAVDFAVQSAKYLPLEITLLHAFEHTGDVYTDYMGVNKAFNQELLDEVHQKLAQLKKAIQETEGITVNYSVITAPLLDSVMQAAAEKKSDLIIMGTLGAGALTEKIWGSKTASLIGKSKVPVMVIPYFYTWKKPEKILFATNHFEKDTAILDYLFEMLGLYMAKMQVAVITDEDDDKAETFLEHRRKLPQYEKMLRETYHDETLAAAHLYGKEFEDTLQRYIEENEIDILAMITYPRSSFWDRLFHPSITKRMTYHTNIPLLAIPAIKEIPI